MVIPGHEDDPLAVGEEWLGLPGFWPAHLLWLAEGENVDPEPAVFELIESAQTRWCPVNAPHRVALVRAGIRFERGQLVERPEGNAA